MFDMRRLLCATACLLCLGLTGCYGDRFQNPADWSMTGAAREDTAMEISNKDNLLEGASEPGSQGVAAAAGVDVAIGGIAGTAAGLQKAPKDITFSSGTGD
jgi:hypothetical protein